MTDKSVGNEKNILFYNDKDGNIQIEVVLENENIWLTQEQISKLYNKVKSTINEHIKNIYVEEELKEEETMRKFGKSEFSEIGKSTLESFLQNVTLSIDNYEKICKDYKNDSLYLSINATNFSDKVTSYKIPLKLDSCLK